MGGVTLVAEGAAARVVRLDLTDAADGVADMWSVELHEPRLLSVGPGIATLGSQLAIVCVRLSALPPDPDPLAEEVYLAGNATHGIALDLVAELAGGGTWLRPGPHVAYAEFVADDDRDAAKVARAVANCVAWGDAPIGVRGTVLAWRACVAGAATVVRQAVAEPQR